MSIPPDIADIVRAADNFASIFLSAVVHLAIGTAIFTLISSYQETRGIVKGTAKGQQAWTEWYHQRETSKVQPPLIPSDPYRNKNPL